MSSFFGKFSIMALVFKFLLQLIFLITKNIEFFIVILI